MSITSSDGANLWWTEEGRGDPVLLINGFTSTADMWYRLTPHLTPGYRVIRFDNRGIGRSDVVDEPCPPATMARDALAVLDAAGVGSAHVIGISLGSVVAQELAATAPERVRSLVLAATNPGGSHAVQADNESMRLVLTASTLGYEELNRRLVPLTYHPSTPAGRIEEDLRVRLQRPPDSIGVKAQSEGIVGWTRYEDLPRIAAPTLVLHGADDLLCPPENGRIVADALPDSDLVLLPNTSHQIFTDQEQAGAEQILRFLGARRQKEMSS